MFFLQVRALVVDGGVPNCVALSLDTIISGWSDGKVRCHSAENGEWLWEIPNAHAGGVTALQMSANQRFIISGGEQGEVRVWELRSRELVSHLKEHTMKGEVKNWWPSRIQPRLFNRGHFFDCVCLQKIKSSKNKVFKKKLTPFFFFFFFFAFFVFFCLLLFLFVVF